MRCEEHLEREATWHVKYVCQLHNEEETFVACGLCRVSLEAHTPDHGETISSHALDSDCKHPESVWKRDGCIVPTTEITIEDLVAEKEPLPA